MNEQLSPAGAKIVGALTELRDALKEGGMSDLPTTELHAAWRFDCNRCGLENFVRAVIPCSLEGQLPEGFEFGDFEGGEWITKPGSVTCSHCGAEFGVED